MIASHNVAVQVPRTTPVPVLVICPVQVQFGRVATNSTTWPRPQRRGSRRPLVLPRRELYLVAPEGLISRAPASDQLSDNGPVNRRTAEDGKGLLTSDNEQSSGPVDEDP
jgi:hypothetical protein